MLDLDGARRIALTVVFPGVELGRVQELRGGWFFPLRASGEPLDGSPGVVVNRYTGKIFHLGSVGSVRRALELYDKGYEFERYKLVITEANDLDQTLNVLLEVGIFVTDPLDDSACQTQRPMTRQELRQSLAGLPCSFENVKLQHRVEYLENASRNGWLRYEAFEHRTAVAPPP